MAPIYSRETRNSRGLRIALGVLVVVLLLVQLRRCGRPEAEETPENVTENVTAEEPAEETVDPRLWTYYDLAGNLFEAELYMNAPRTDLDPHRFVHTGHFVRYLGDHYESLQGIDVSEHNLEIDWEHLEEEGVQFAFIRLGYRGYTEGSINLDAYFEENLAKARQTGLKLGVYFFSQAINEEEAVEEADFVLTQLRAHDFTPDLPIVYDPEFIDGAAESRTDGLSPEQVTANTLAFCNRIRSAGFEPMIYCNLYWQAYVLNMDKLAGIPVWLADYRFTPQSPYAYQIWQYDYRGRLESVPTTVDMNVMLVPATP